MKSRLIKLPPPYLKSVWLDLARVPDPAAYPFCLPFLSNGFQLEFERPITIIVGENGTGKSTLLEGIAALAGYDEAGGGKGYRPVDHSQALEAMGGRLAKALRASWLPKITNGWFFRAESFFSVARYLDAAALNADAAPPDFLSHSHGEGFLRFFRGALQPSGHLHFRRTGIRVVAVAADGIFKATAPHGTVRHLPSRHGDPFADPHGLSGRAAVALIQIRPRTDCGRTDRSFPTYARVLRRSGDLRAERYR
jgi:energy-coupling factor transporter ATP-binding protein EcfA2